MIPNQIPLSLFVYSLWSDSQRKLAFYQSFSNVGVWSFIARAQNCLQDNIWNKKERKNRRYQILGMQHLNNIMLDTVEIDQHNQLQMFYENTTNMSFYLFEFFTWLINKPNYQLTWYKNCCIWKPHNKRTGFSII